MMMIKPATPSVAEPATPSVAVRLTTDHARWPGTKKEGAEQTVWHTMFFSWLGLSIKHVTKLLNDPVFGFSDLVRHKPGSTTTQDG